MPNSGYTTCACRDCFDIAISNSSRTEEYWDEESEDWIQQEVTDPALCWECQEAGCTPQGESDAVEVTSVNIREECQRDDAYGAACEAHHPEVHDNP